MGSSSFELERIARELATLKRQVDGLTTTRQIVRSEIAGESVGDLLETAQSTAVTVDEHATDIAMLDDGMGVEIADRIQDVSDAQHSTDMDLIATNQTVQQALDDADAAAVDAAFARETALGFARYTQVDGGPITPDLPEDGPRVGAELIYVDTAGHPYQANVWNGSAWVKSQYLIDSLLALGPNGTVQIENGRVVSPEIYGGEIYGGYMEAPVIASSAQLGSGANVLDDPNFTSAVDTAWVASGHLGDAPTSSNDTFSWDQTVTKLPGLNTPQMTKRYQGSGVSRLELTPAQRSTGSLLFANYAWKPGHRTFSNPVTYANPEAGNAVVIVGAYSSEWGKSAAPSLGIGVERTTYLENSGVASMQAGEQWNLRLAFGGLTAATLNLVQLRLELVDQSTSAVAWFYDLTDAEKIAGSVNKWVEAGASASVKLRVRAVYSAAGGAVERRLAVGGYSRLYADGELAPVSWVASQSDNYHPYGSVPLTLGSPWATTLPENIKSRAELQIVLTSAVLAKVEPRKGWRLTESNGLELFNQIGAKTGSIDGENNFLAGRFATAESGLRWEIQGERVAFYNAAEQIVGGMRRSGAGIELFGQVSFDGDTDWKPIAVTWASGFGGTVSYMRRAGWLQMNVVMTNSTIPAGSTTVCSGIHAALCPTDSNAFAVAYLGGGYTGTLFIRPNGEIAVAQQTGAARPNPQGTLTYAR